MKTLSVLLFLLTQFTFGQTKALKLCGTNDEPLLNRQEAIYFNEALADHRGDFDFNGKHIAFANGNGGRLQMALSYLPNSLT